MSTLNQLKKKWLRDPEFRRSYEAQKPECKLTKLAGRNLARESDMQNISFGDIQKEFQESLGFIRNDITAIRHGKETVNYTVALLVGCGCEALAGGMGDRKHPEKKFAELLPPGDRRLLAERLFNAVRNGLAHRFDTKHLEVDGKVIQIYISWSLTQVLEVRPVSGGLGLYIGIQPLAEGLCKKIDEFEDLLKRDEGVRRRFRADCEDDNRKARLNTSETKAWHRLVTASGY